MKQRLRQIANPLAAASVFSAAMVVLFSLRENILLAAESRDVSPSTASPAELSFEKDIASIFAAKCTRCHGKDVQKSELNLTIPQSVLKGGASGESVVPHKPDESLLYDYISTDQMPPEEVKNPKLRLTEEEKKLIHDWIESGAKFDAHDLSAIAEPEVITEDNVLPMLLSNCAICHGRNKQEAALDLRTRESILKGGRSGPAVVPGHPEQSLLLKRVHAGEMPPKRRLVTFSVKPLDPSSVETLAKWIGQGALPSNLPDDVATTDPDAQVSDEDREFWSFQSPKPVVPPRVSRSDCVRNPIDAFVQHKLEAVGLSLAPEADLRTLVRRAYFDLTGLPPTPEEMEAVLADPDPRAYEKLIDRLLDSPHYGERWGRYWLDLAGYADSEGTTSQDLVRPFAYRYRDYVIQAFNKDKPYDRFLLEQLAGDELADYENAEVITPEIYDNLVATGFLRMAPDGSFSSTNNYVPDRLMIIADELQVIGSSIMGLTIQCARCHSHKFDPIPHRDYYRMMAVFKPAQDEFDWICPNSYPVNDPNNPPKTMEECRYLPYVTDEELAPVKRHNEPLQKQIAELQAEKKLAADRVRESLLEERLKTVSEQDRKMLTVALEVSTEKRTSMQRVTIDAMTEQLEIDEDVLLQNEEYKELAERLDKQIAKLEKQLQPIPMIRAAWDRGSPSPTYIFHRGEAGSPQRRVGPGVPSVLTDGKTPFEVQLPWPGAKSTGRRLAFAKWLVQPDHPLTARVMVNRIWLHHFGRGIVSPPDNFGKKGTPPTHPELLDWLAIEFMQQGWSIKAMHRLMMTSSTYRQSSQVTDEQLQHDPENYLLSRMPLRRMDAESLRDSILFVSGRLDETQFGPPDEVDVRADGLITVREGERGWRRSIYAKQRRTELPSLLESFDLPQMSPNCVARPSSTVAPQALQLTNDAQIQGLAQSLANRIKADVGDDSRKQIERLFSIAINRAPTAEELELAQSSFEALTSHWLEQRPEIAVESSAETWIRESEPETVYEKDLVYVHSSRGHDKARRSTLLEFDLSHLNGKRITAAYLQLSPTQSGARIHQGATLVPPGIGGATWKKYETNHALFAQALESFGAFRLTTRGGDVGSYLASEMASATDLKKLQSRIDAEGHVALVLMAVEDRRAYQAEWDDGEGPGTNGKKPRLALRVENAEPAGGPADIVIEQARLSALTNLCHAMINSPEFMYVD